MRRSRRWWWLLGGGVCLAAAATVLTVYWVPIKYYVVGRPFVGEAIYAAREQWAESTRERPSCDASTPAEGSANVVVIAVDTLRADRLSAYGYAAARTPVLQALSRDSDGPRRPDSYSILWR